MISGFQRPLSIPQYAFIEERLTLIIDFYHLLLRLLAAEAFDKQTNRVSTDAWPINTRYKRDCYLVRHDREGHE